jgi:SAM-dependent methyltransferase
MSSESSASTNVPATTGEIRAWSEDRLTARARAIWSGADFLPIARSFADGAAEFIGRLGLRPGETVLDVACGTGNLAIPAARAGARVTGVDIAPNLIAEAQLEARSTGLSIAFEVGDAESLPYRDGQFDTTVTMFGAMFAYRPARAAAQLLRVTRPGGRIAMANWTPGSVIGDLLRAHVAVVPPPADVPSSLLWGDEDTVRARFGDGVRAITFARRSLELRFSLAPPVVTELFATSYGPTVATLAAAGPEGRLQLRDAMTRLFTENNRATGAGTVISGEYLDVQVALA